MSREVFNLSYQDLAYVVRCIRDVLYRDEQGVLDANKEWNAETIEDVAQIIIDAGLSPDKL